MDFIHRYLLKVVKASFSMGIEKGILLTLKCNDCYVVVLSFFHAL